MVSDLIWPYQRKALFFCEIFKKKDAEPLDNKGVCTLVCWHHSTTMKGEEVKGAVGCAERGRAWR